jgi:hypothetical protein
MEKIENYVFDSKYLDRIKDINFRPIFIMGVQRSGTSILYKILNETGEFHIVTAYHLINYDRLVYDRIHDIEGESKAELKERFSRMSQDDRGIDRLKITPDFAEEYGFLLAKKTNVSKINEDNIFIFNELCQKITFLKESDKPLLLKNPFDFANFVFIKGKYPEAKFVFIHRNPINTINSQLKAMRTLLSKKSKYMALLSPWYDKIFDHKLKLMYYRFLYSSKTSIRVNSAINKLSQLTNYYLENISKLKENFDYINVRYEDLCSSTELMIKKIFSFLSISPPVGFEYESYIRPRETTLLKELIDRKYNINRKMSQYLGYFNYNLK